MEQDEGPTDWADRHVARWRDHWIDISFDDDIEAITVRVSRVTKALQKAKQDAAREVGLQDFEYETLHVLMIRDTPGRAAPSELAEDLAISNAGMTGRLDTMEKAGWIQRRADPADRRRVHVEATRAGITVWRRAMELRGRQEDALLSVMTPDERHTLAALLKRLTLEIEESDASGLDQGQGLTAT